MRANILAISAILFVSTALNSVAVEKNNYQLNSLNITNRFGNALSVFVGYDRGFNNFSKDKFASQDYQNNALEAGLGYNLYYKLNNKVDLFTGLRAVGRFNLDDKKYILKSNGRSALKAIGDTTEVGGITYYEVGADADGNPIRATEGQIIDHNNIYLFSILEYIRQFSFTGTYPAGTVERLNYFSPIGSSVAYGSNRAGISFDYHRIANAVINPHLLTTAQVIQAVRNGVRNFEPGYTLPLISGVDGTINYNDMEDIVFTYNEVYNNYLAAYLEGEDSVKFNNVTVKIDSTNINEAEEDANKVALMVTGVLERESEIVEHKATSLIPVPGNTNTNNNNAGNNNNNTDNNNNAGNNNNGNANNNNNGNNNTTAEYRYAFKEIAYFAVPFGARIKINKDLSVEPYALAGINLARINIQNGIIDETKNKVGATFGAGVSLNVWKERLFAGVEYRYSVNKYNGVKFETNNVGVKLGYKFNF